MLCWHQCNVLLLFWHRSVVLVPWWHRSIVLVPWWHRSIVLVSWWHRCIVLCCTAISVLCWYCGRSYQCIVFVLCRHRRIVFVLCWHQCVMIVLCWLGGLCLFRTDISVLCLCRADISVPLRKRTLKHVFSLAGVNIYPAHISQYKDNVWCSCSYLDTYHIDGFVLRFSHQWYRPRNFANCWDVNGTDVPVARNVRWSTLRLIADLSRDLNEIFPLLVGI